MSNLKKEDRLDTNLTEYINIRLNAYYMEKLYEIAALRRSYKSTVLRKLVIEAIDKIIPPEEK